MTEDSLRISKLIDLSLLISESDSIDSVEVRNHLILSSISLPSLDDDSMCTGSSNSTSCDSVDSVESNNRRKIFGSYWEKNCTKVKSPENMKQKSSVYHSAANECLVDSFMSFTPTLDQRREIDRVVDTPPAPRRKIFERGYVSESAPNLTFCSKPLSPTIIRNESSSSSLPEIGGCGKPPKTCLRRSRFSFKGRNTVPQQKLSSTSSSDSLVSFNPTVDIIIYQEPKEFWGSDNWKTFFE